MVGIGAMDHRMLGIACVVGAVSIFILQDATIKWLSGDYPLHEIVLVRANSAVAVTLVAMRLEGGLRLWRTRRVGLHLARSTLLVIANSTFFLALAAMTIAEATSIFFIAPVLITALSTLVLRESVGLHRWAAVCVGLTGIIVMLRPGEGTLRLVALFPLAAACCYAVMQIMTRRLGTTERASTISFYAQAGFIAASVTMGLAAGDGRFSPDDGASLSFLLRAWTVPSTADGALFIGIGALNGVASYLMSPGIPHLGARCAGAVRVRGAAYVGVLGGAVLRRLAGRGDIRRDGAGLRQRPLRAEPREAPRATLLGNIEAMMSGGSGSRRGHYMWWRRGHHRVSQLASRAIYGLSYRTPLEILANVKEEIDGNVGSLGMIVAFVGGRRRGA